MGAKSSEHLEVAESTEDSTEDKKLKFQVFDRVDANADGTVSKDELEQAVSSDTSHLPALMEEAGLDPTANVIEQMDKDKDGRVTWDEFKSDLRTAEHKKPSCLAEILACCATPVVESSVKFQGQ